MCACGHGACCALESPPSAGHQVHDHVELVVGIFAGQAMVEVQAWPGNAILLCVKPQRSMKYNLCFFTLHYTMPDQALRISLFCVNQQVCVCILLSRDHQRHSMTWHILTPDFQQALPPNLVPGDCMATGSSQISGKGQQRYGLQGGK